MRAYAAKDGKSAGEIPLEGELAAPPHFSAAGANGLPMIVAVTQDIAKGASVTATTRAIEPAVVPVAPLPGVVSMIPPVGPPKP